MPIDPSKLTRRGLIALAATSPLAFAASDFWNKKPGAEWTPEEVQALRSKSPWAKKVAGESAGGGARGAGGFDASGNEEASSGGSGGGRGGGGGGKRGGGGGGGGAAQGRGGGQSVEVLVRWESARPLLEKNPLPSGLKDHYAVSVTGLPPALVMSVGRGAPMPPDPAEREKAMIARLLHSAVLSTKGNDPATAALLFQTADKQSLIFGFKRDGFPLEVSNKNVEFTLKLGGNTFKAKFDLKEMMFNGELAV